MDLRPTIDESAPFEPVQGPVPLLTNVGPDRGSDRGCPNRKSSLLDLLLSAIYVSDCIVKRTESVASPSHEDHVRRPTETKKEKKILECILELLRLSL